MKRSKRHIEHYLITLPIGQMHLHGYLMTDDKRYVQHTMNQMVDIAEREGPWLLPMILQTTLSTGVDVVREVLCEIDEKAAQRFAAAKDYHLSIFSLTAHSPEDDRLMELH